MSLVAKKLATLPLVRLMGYYLLLANILIPFIGGSTIVTLFKKGQVAWDEDLSINSRASLETLVRVGMGIGHKVSS